MEVHPRGSSGPGRGRGASTRMGASSTDGGALLRVGLGHVVQGHRALPAPRWRQPTRQVPIEGRAPAFA
eukprot:5401198-Lingulodinium_polyedra.AAC.1